MKNSLDILAIGNAIVDVISDCDDALLETLDLRKGTMRLVTAEESAALHRHAGHGQKVSGGSAANTAVGVAALGGSAAFVGRVSDDPLGHAFADDIRAAGVAFETPYAGAGRPTGCCMVFVTPDAERTMATYLGSCQELGPEDIDEARVAEAKITYFEGYLWGGETTVPALRRAFAAAKKAERRVAFAVSDASCVEAHRADFFDLLAQEADIVFANAREAAALFETDDMQAIVDGFAATGRLAVVTRSEKGAIIVEGDRRVEVAAVPTKVVDTTGAGDLFAAGFLTGLAHGRPLAECGALGAVAASEVIGHFGARPQADFRARALRHLGQAAG